MDANKLSIDDRFSFKDNSFNFMFALWSNNFLQPSTETIKRYVHWEVSMIEKVLDPTNPYISKFVQIPVKFHKCKEKDNNYVDFVEHQKGAEVFTKEMYCLD